jgi:hypothetical protein
MSGTDQVAKVPWAGIEPTPVAHSALPDTLKKTFDSLSLRRRKQLG